jgi:hypothetical protein
MRLARCESLLRRKLRGITSTIAERRSTGAKARRIGKPAVAALVRRPALIYLNVLSTALNENIRDEA